MLYRFEREPHGRQGRRMKFLGRTEQRKKLHRMVDKSGQTVSLVYGRRRVGKSEVIKQVLSWMNIPIFGTV